MSTLVVEAGEMKRSQIEAEWRARINIDPEIQGGRPVVNGTRVPLYVLVGSLAGGDSAEQICEDYNVTYDDLRAALAFAAELLAEKRAHAVHH
jgi:uncharacterized protein (DUF433 family)